MSLEYLLSQLKAGDTWPTPRVTTRMLRTAIDVIEAQAKLIQDMEQELRKYRG